MTSISGVPDELHGYTEATTNSTLLLSSSAAVALAAVTAFNDANAGSDLPGSIDDVATPVDQEADILADHDRIPGAFADALLALDADGAADLAGRYQIDAMYTAFVDDLVAARVDNPYGTDTEIFDAALHTFDPGFAETYIETRDDAHHSATTAAIWETAITRQTVKDAELIELLLSDGAGGAPNDGGMGYASLESIMASVASRSENLDGYAEGLYVDELGPEGVSNVLGWFETLAHHDGADGAMDGPDLRTDLLVPFASGFAVAAASPQGAPLIAHFTDIDQGDNRERETAMLVSAAPQPAAFLVPAADALLVEHAYLDPRIGESWYGPPSVLFGPEGPDDLRVVVVEALGANPEASEQFAALGPDQVEALVFGAGGVGFEGDPDHTRYLDAAGDVIEHAVITEGEFGTADQRTRTDEILIDLITVADGDVPDQMKEHLAGVSALTMGRIEDLVVGDIPAIDGEDLPAEVQAYFAELSHDERAVELLTLGALDQYQVGMQEGLANLATLDPAQQAVLSNVNDYLEGGTRDGRTLLGVLGAGFDDADVAAEARHAAGIGALNFIGDAAPRIGVALTPLTGGTSALVSAGIMGVADLGIAAFDDATAPDETDGEYFINGVTPGVEELTRRVLYENPDIRTAVVEAAAVAVDADAITFDDFVDLVPVVDIVDRQTEAAEQATAVHVLLNGYFR